MSHSHQRSDAFTRQPNSRHCFVCGLDSPVGLKAHFEDNGVDEVRATYHVKEVYQGYPGVVHGGIVAALLDEAAGRTAMISDPNRFMFTGRIQIKYRQPVPTETDLTLVGWLIKDRGRAAQAHSEIRLPDGSLAAEADVMMIQVPDDALPAGADAESLGWRVYPDQSFGTGDD